MTPMLCSQALVDRATSRLTNAWPSACQPSSRSARLISHVATTSPRPTSAMFALAARYRGASEQLLPAAPPRSSCSSSAQLLRRSSSWPRVRPGAGRKFRTRRGFGPTRVSPVAVHRENFSHNRCVRAAASVRRSDACEPRGARLRLRLRHRLTSVTSCSKRVASRRWRSHEWSVVGNAALCACVARSMGLSLPRRAAASISTCADDSRRASVFSAVAHEPPRREEATRSPRDGPGLGPGDRTQVSARFRQPVSQSSSPRIRRVTTGD